MALWVHCPQCDQHYQFPETTAGKQAACPKCGRLLAVSAPPRAPMPIPPAPRLPQPASAPQEEEPLWALPVPSQGRRPAGPGADNGPPRPAPPAARRPPPAPAPLRPVEEPLDPSLPATAGDNPTAYYQPVCRGSTTFSPDVAARITGDPFGFIPATFCAKCQRYVGLRTVVWQGTRENLAAYRARLRRQMHPAKILLRVLGGPLIGALLGAAIGAVANAGNARAMGLGILAGVLVGLPLGWFVTGIAFQIAWSLARKGKGNAAPGASTPGAGA